MGLSSTKAEDRDPERQRAGSEAPRLPQSLLEPIRDLNQQLLGLLVEHADNPEFQAGSQLGRALRDVDPKTRENLALCPFLLLDAGFRDPMRWQQAAAAVEQALAEQTRSAAEPSSKAFNLGRAACVLGWHLVRTDPIAAGLILDVSPQCAKLIARLSLTDLEQIAEQLVRHGRIQPRWHDRPEVWRRLIRLAQTSPRRAFASVNIRGRQLLLGAHLLPEDGP